ncbi:MAG: hypothetical protein ABR540_01510, partial [Acidimicrobiales bacterium]
APSPDASIEELRADLADAQAELQGLPAATTAARAGGHSTEWMGLLTRADELPVEIAAARQRLLAAQLAQAWVTAERCDATETLVMADIAATQAAKEDHARAVGAPKNTSAAEVTATPTWRRSCPTHTPPQRPPTAWPSTPRRWR